MHLYVGNLPLKVSPDEIKGEFSIFGEVKSIHLMNDKDIGSGQPTGYGYVEMASDPQGKAALAGLKGKLIKGRPIVVIESLSFSKQGGEKAVDSRRSGRYNRKMQRTYNGKPRSLF